MSNPLKHPIPRIRGRVGKVTDPPELKGKWTYELHLGWFGGGEKYDTFQGEFFDTEAEAIRALKLGCTEAVKKLQEAFGVEPTGSHIDLKTNETHNFEREQ